MDLRNRKGGSSSGSGSGLLKRGLNLVAILEDSQESIPLSSIPTDVDFAYLRELLQHSKIALKSGQVWANVEFYSDEHFFFPLEEKMTLSQANLQDGQTLYLAYKTRTSSMEPLSIVIPMRRRPIILKNLPPWATVAGLKKMLASICEPTEINMKNFWLRRHTDDKDMALPDSVQLSRIRSNQLIVESELSSWEELKSVPKVVTQFPPRNIFNPMCSAY